MRSPRAQVFSAIDGERRYQQGRWGAGGEQHSALEYLAYIQDYVSEAMHRLSRTSDAQAAIDTQHSLRKIAALAVCALERHGAIERD